MKKTKQQINEFDTAAYQIQRLSGRPLPFSKLYLSKNIALKYLLAAILGVVYACLTLFFIKNTGGYSYGLSSLLQGISKLCSYFVYKAEVKNASAIYSAMFWGLILVCNIPLFIFSWKKIGHRFTLLTLTFLLVNTAAGLGFDQIPNIANCTIFGKTNLTGSAQWITDLTNNHIQVLPFSVPSSLSLGYDAGNYVKPLILILSTVAYSFIAAFAFSILFIIGGCTAGTDFISVYLASRTKVKLSSFFFCLNLVCITLGSTLGCFIPSCLNNKDCVCVEFFFSANYVATVISLAVFTVLYKKIYPTGFRCKVEVYSKKHKEIKTDLYKHKYVHGSNLTEVTGGFSNKANGKFSTLCSYIELPLIIDRINKIDEHATIAITKLAAIDGNFAIKNPGKQ